MRANAPRNTKEYGSARGPKLIPAKCPPGQIVYAGTMVGRKAGKVVSVSEAGVTEVLGRAEKTVDNRTGSADVNYDAARGTFGWDSDGTLNETHLGEMVYALDDHTVTLNGTDATPAAGRLQHIEGGQFYVESPY